MSPITKEKVALVNPRKMYKVICKGKEYRGNVIDSTDNSVTVHDLTTREHKNFRLVDIDVDLEEIGSIL